MADARTNRGFALIYVACIVFLMAAFGLTLLSQYAINESTETRDTSTLLDRIYRGIVGDPEKGKFGYIGDVGDYPSSLKDLIERPSSNPSGWNGPYLTDVPYDGTTGAILDYSYSPIEYFLARSVANTTGDSIALIGRGFDHTSTNTIGNSNPNSWSNFIGVLPTSASYTSGFSDNADNVMTPSTYGAGNKGLLFYPHGALSVTLSNSDSVANGLRNACPNMYNVVVTSAIRGLADGVTVAYGDANTIDLVQGLWNVQIGDTLGTFVYAKDHSVTMMGGTQTRSMRVFPDVNSASTPQKTVTIVNNDTGTQVDFYVNGTKVQSSINTTSSKAVGSLRTCGYAELRTAGGSTVLDSWILPWATDSTRYYSATTRYSVTVVNGGGTYRQLGVKTHSPGSTVATVYQKHSTTFTVPNGTLVTITSSNGTTVDSFNVSGATTKSY